MRIVSLWFLTALFLVLPSLAVYAQSKDAVPPMPAPIDTLQQQGAQVRYLGRTGGLDGWLTIKGGQEQYFYVTLDGEAMVMGLMFDKTGKMITLRQINELREKEGSVLDMFALDQPEEKTLSLDGLTKNMSQYKSPAEQLFEDVENSNWVYLGKEGAPVIYTFVDPQCPHCHAFINDLRYDYIQNGMVQVRMIPIGFREETLAQAAFLLAAPDPEGRWYRHLDGDKDALPVTKSINQQGVQRNLAIMQSWKLNVTPLTIYRASNGKVKIVEGRSKDASSLIADIEQ